MDEPSNQAGFLRNPSPQSVWGLNLLLFFLSDVRNGVGPLLSIYLLGTLHWDAALIGLSLALVELSSFSAQIPSGWLADETHYKKTMVGASCVLIFTCCLMILLFPFVFTVLVAQFLMGFSIALITPALGSITLGLFGRERLPKRSAKNEQWNHFGNISTALIAGLTSFFLGNEWVFYVVMLFCLCSLVALSFIKSNEIDYNAARELTPHVEGVNTSSQPASLLSLLKDKNILIFNTSLILYFIANGSQMALLGQKVTVIMPEYGSLFFSSSMVIAEVTMLIVASIMALIVTKYGRKVFLSIAFFIIPLRAFLYTLSDNPYFNISIQILDGTAAGILGVIGIVIISDLAKGTGRFNFLLGLVALSISVGETISLTLGGLIAKNFGFNSAFTFLACVGLIAFLFFTAFMPETKSAQTE